MEGAPVKAVPTPKKKDASPSGTGARQEQGTFQHKGECRRKQEKPGQDRLLHRHLKFRARHGVTTSSTVRGRYHRGISRTSLIRTVRGWHGSASSSEAWKTTWRGRRKRRERGKGRVRGAKHSISQNAMALRGTV